MESTPPSPTLSSSATLDLEIDLDVDQHLPLVESEAESVNPPLEPESETPVSEDQEGIASNRKEEQEVSNVLDQEAVDVLSTELALVQLEEAVTTKEVQPQDTPNKNRLSLLSLSDELLLSIAECFTPEQPECRKPVNLHNLRLTCRHLSTLLRPVFWRVVEVADGEDAALVLRSWILYPETRKLTKILNCCSDEVFSRAATALGLGLTHLRISSFDGRDDVGNCWTDGIVQEGLREQLEEFCLVDFVGGFEDPEFGFGKEWKALKELQISWAMDKPERFFGVGGLQDLRVLTTDEYVQDDDEDEDESENEGAEDEDNEGNNGGGSPPPTPLGQKLIVVEHYLPTLEGLCLHGGSEGRYRYLHPKIGKKFSAILAATSKELESTSIAPKLTGFSTNNLLLFHPSSSPPRSPLLEILVSLQNCPKLTALAFRGFGTFHPPKDYEDKWNDVRMNSVTELILECWGDERRPVDYKGLLNEKTLRPLVHFTRIFPALHFLTIMDAFPPSSEPSLESQLACASPNERALLHTSLCTFLSFLLRESVVVSVRVGMLECFRRDSTVPEWEWDLVHDLAF